MDIINDMLEQHNLTPKPRTFTDLPLEIRQQIYRYTFSFEKADKHTARRAPAFQRNHYRMDITSLHSEPINRALPPPIAQVSRQLRSESLPLFDAVMLWRFYRLEGLEDWVRATHGRDLSALYLQLVSRTEEKGTYVFVKVDFYLGEAGRRGRELGGGGGGRAQSSSQKRVRSSSLRVRDGPIFWSDWADEGLDMLCEKVAEGLSVKRKEGRLRSRDVMEKIAEIEVLLKEIASR